MDENQCTDTVSKIINVRDNDKIVIPNIFTPNGDGANDGWKPTINNLSKENYKLTVFNRWGTIVFSTTDTEQAWDGTWKGRDAAAGVYFSIVEYTTTHDKTLRYANSSVTLIR